MEACATAPASIRPRAEVGWLMMLAVCSVSRSGIGAREAEVLPGGRRSDRACRAGRGFRIGAAATPASRGSVITGIGSTPGCTPSGPSVATRPDGGEAATGGGGRTTISVGAGT